MKGAINFLTFTAVDGRYGSRSKVSVPLSQVREIKEQDFSGALSDHHLKDVKASIQMAQKDMFYWTLEGRQTLLDQINGLT